MLAIAPVLSALHLLALAIGLPAIAIRARSLAASHDPLALRTAFRADAMWGLAAILWLLTGAARAFGPFEKGTLFYLDSRLFWIKMILLGLVIVLELAPMIAMIRWRIALAHGHDPDLSRAPVWAAVSWVQTLIVVSMVFIAAFMARGYGAGR